MRHEYNRMYKGLFDLTGRYQYSRSGERSGPGIRGVKGPSEMLKNNKDLKVWQKFYELCLEI